MLIKLALAPVLSLQLPNQNEVLFVGLVLAGVCFWGVAVVVAWRGRGEKKDGGE